MGNCTCFKAESQIEKLEESSKPVLQDSDRHNQTPINKVSNQSEHQIEMQGFFRGYLTRKKLAPRLAQYKKAKPPFKIAGIDLLKIFIKKKISLRADELLGPVNMSDPLDDGINVISRPSLTLKDGTIYQGEWNEQERPHGRGHEERPDGTKMQGYYKRGLLEGFGRALFNDGTVFQGNFKKGTPQGTGIFIDKESAKYEGQFRDGNLIGSGKKVNPDGSIYEGQFKEWTMHGKGTLTFPNGHIYEGDFKNNEISGRGKIIFSDGRLYDGLFSQGQINGRGTMRWPNGDVHNGGFVDGRPHGRGMLKMGNGEVHKCEWVKGKQSGEGTISTKDDKGQMRIEKVVWEKGKIVDRRENWKGSKQSEKLIISKRMNTHKFYGHSVSNKEFSVNNNIQKIKSSDQHDYFQH